MKYATYLHLIVMKQIIHIPTFIKHKDKTTNYELRHSNHRWWTGRL